MKKQGFTLVEILVVMVVIGILIALIIPNALKAIEIANTKTCANNIRTIDSAIQLYYAQNRAWPSSVNDLCDFLDDVACTGAAGSRTFAMKCPITETAYTLNAGNKSADRTSHFAANDFPNKHIMASP